MDSISGRSAYLTRPTGKPSYDRTPGHTDTGRDEDGAGVYMAPAPRSISACHSGPGGGGRNMLHGCSHLADNGR